MTEAERKQEAGFIDHQSHKQLRFTTGQPVLPYTHIKNVG